MYHFYIFPSWLKDASAWIHYSCFFINIFPCISHQGENFFAKIFVTNLDSLLSFVNFKLSSYRKSNYRTLYWVSWISSYQAIGSQTIGFLSANWTFYQEHQACIFLSSFLIFLDLIQFEFEFKSVFFPKRIKLRNHHSHRLRLHINLDDYMIQQYVSYTLVTLHA